MNLGKLEKVDDLREIWKNESSDFTTWLSENLQLLGDEIGVEGIKLIETEASAGKYKVDILAEEQNSDRLIIIENQLEKTDHDHLGKMITYASVKDAKIIIWIVRKYEDEHKLAVDWLNEHTDERLNFFLMEIQLWKIDDSNLAPKFQIISEPNDWAKVVKNSSGQSELSKTKLTQYEFWNKLKDYANANEEETKIRLTKKPVYGHWYNIRFGSSLALIGLRINTGKKLLGCGLRIPDSKEFYNFLIEKKEEIKEKIGLELEWNSPLSQKESNIFTYFQGDLEQADRWEEYHKWFLSTSKKFREVFSDLMRNFQGYARQPLTDLDDKSVL